MYLIKMNILFVNFILIPTVFSVHALSKFLSFERERESELDREREREKECNQEQKAD